MYLSYSHIYFLFNTFILLNNNDKISNEVLKIKTSYKYNYNFNFFYYTKQYLIICYKTIYRVTQVKVYKELNVDVQS